MSRGEIPLVEITPADREVYLIATNGVVRGGNDPLVCAMVRRGVDDQQPAMQAIARHRILATATSAAKIADDKAAKYMAIGQMTDDFLIQLQAKRGAEICTEIANAIRQLAPETVEQGGGHD